MNPTRNEVSPEHSACDAVAEATDLELPTVETIWKRRTGTQANRHRTRGQYDGGMTFSRAAWRSWARHRGTASARRLNHT